MNAAPDQPVAKARRSWPRIHLIYFVLAAFDLLAVAGGLYLSHRLAGVFEDNAAVSEEWSGRFRLVWNLSDQAAAINTPGNSVFESHDPNAERARLEEATKRFGSSLTSIQSDLIAHIPPTSLTRVSAAFAGVRSSADQIRKSAEKVLDFYAAGDLAQASAANAQMDRYYDEFKRKLDTTAALMMTIQAKLNQQHSAEVARLRQFEYVIGGGIVVMVLCVAVYGLWIGRLIKSKYRELEAAHVESESFANELKTVNSDISKLNRDLADNMRRLSEAQNEIIRKGKAAQLGQLTTAIAHELRNPLGAMRTSTFLIERKIKSHDLAIAPQLQRINNGIARCDNILSQLLDLSQPRHHESESVAIDDWLARLVQEEADKLPAAIRIECRLGLEGVTAAINAPQVGRAVMHLLSNAAEALAGKGDDPARFATTAPCIVIETRNAPRGIEISVRDNGPGIAPEMIEKIREPLFTTKSEGTGLGLAAVEKILEQHEGGLDIASEPGKGACFTAWLPAERKQQEAA